MSTNSMQLPHDVLSFARIGNNSRSINSGDRMELHRKSNNLQSSRYDKLLVAGAIQTLFKTMSRCEVDIRYKTMKSMLAELSSCTSIRFSVIGKGDIRVLLPIVVAGSTTTVTESTTRGWNIAKSRFVMSDSHHQHNDDNSDSDLVAADYMNTKKYFLGKIDDDDSSSQNSIAIAQYDSGLREFILTTGVMYDPIEELGISHLSMQTLLQLHLHELSMSLDEHGDGREYHIAAGEINMVDDDDGVLMKNMEYEHQLARKSMLQLMASSDWEGTKL